MKYGVPISVRLSEEKDKKLAELAQKLECSKGSLIRQAVSKFLLDQE